MSLNRFGVPILLISDNPCMSGGLSRVCRDLATLCCTLPQLRVGVLGRGIRQNRRLPFILYDYPESGGWGEGYLQDVWNDFAGDEHGIIWTLDDLSRRHWLVNPIGMPERLQQFLGNGHTFQRWAYVPLDSTGPDGRSLSQASTDCLLRFDRVLAASEWGMRVMITSGRTDADWQPHGLWMDKFRPHHNPAESVGWNPNEIWVGMVAANQARKDFPAAFQCFAALKHKLGNLFRAWVHTDTMIGYWNTYALAADYGVGNCLEVTTGSTDEQLALRYSACDVTVMPTAGEGFCLPIAESLACGTACITTDYAAGQELVDAKCRVKPATFRVDTQHNVMRAVLHGMDFAGPAEEQIHLKREDREYRSRQLAQAVEHLGWDKLKYGWIRWIRDGIQA